MRMLVVVLGHHLQGKAWPLFVLLILFSLCFWQTDACKLYMYTYEFFRHGQIVCICVAPRPSLAQRGMATMQMLVLHGLC